MQTRPTAELDPSKENLIKNVTSSDDRDRLLWNAPPVPRTKPRPGELLLGFVRKDGIEIACELRYHGEYGVEAQFFRRGEFWYSRRFPLRAQAVQWAEEERKALEVHR